jgi:hypothetical protein
MADLQWLGLVLLVVFPAMYVWIIWDQWRLERTLRARGLTTVGTVVKVKRHVTSGYGTTQWVSTIRFADAEGIEHECTRGERAVEGDECLVRYDPRDPSKARAVSRPGAGEDPGVGPVWKLVGSAGLLGIAMTPGLLLLYFGSST